MRLMSFMLTPDGVARVDAWLARECPHCHVAPGHDCKPDDGRGLIHGQRTAGPRYPHGEPSPEYLAAIETRREQRRAVLANAEPQPIARVEPVQLDLLPP